MKKLIAILAIMVVLVGAVFATTNTETHKIRIYSVVDEILPTFQLRYAAESAITNNSTVRFSNNATYLDPTTGLNNNTTDSFDSHFDIGAETAEGALTVVFTCNLVADADTNFAKTQKSFTITFSDGVFAVKRSGVTENQTLAPYSITSVAGVVTTGITSITPNNENGASTYTTGAKSSSTTVAFSGETVTAAQVLTTATYAYTGDPTIDMGTYYADIVMTITNEN